MPADVPQTFGYTQYKASFQTFMYLLQPRKDPVFQADASSKLSRKFVDRYVRKCNSRKDGSSCSRDGSAVDVLVAGVVTTR